MTSYIIQAAREWVCWRQEIRRSGRGRSRRRRTVEDEVLIVSNLNRCGTQITSLTRLHPLLLLHLHHLHLPPFLLLLLPPAPGPAPPRLPQCPHDNHQEREHCSVDHNYYMLQPAGTSKSTRCRVGVRLGVRSRVGAEAGARYTC